MPKTAVDENSNLLSPEHKVRSTHYRGVPSPTGDAVLPQALRVIIGSVTTSVAIVVGGIALMVLPTLIVGNELLILGGVAVAVGGWFLAHRHGQLKGFVDANKNGIDDRVEATRAGKV